jgi:hypothetical protein
LSVKASPTIDATRNQAAASTPFILTAEDGRLRP